MSPPGQNEKKRRIDTLSEDSNAITMNLIKKEMDNKIEIECGATDQYGKSDKGPYIVIMKSSKENTKISDIKAGKILNELNMKGIINTSKVNNFSVKVTFNTYQQANELVKNEKINDFSINVYIPNNIITKKGIVNDVGSDISLKEIAQAIKSSCPILSVQRLTRRNNDFNALKEENENNKKYIETNKLIVFFRAQELPEKLTIFHALRKIEMFKPRVRYCFQCQSYGHTHTEKFPCRAKKVCERCTEEHDEKVNCNIRCKFCKKNHKSSSRDCEYFAHEERVQLQAYYSNKSPAEVRKEIGVYTTNTYAILSTQDFPNLQQSESNENFIRDFKKTDERLQNTLKKPQEKKMSFDETLKNFGHDNSQNPSTSTSTNETDQERKLRRARLQEKLRTNKLENTRNEQTHDYSDKQRSKNNNKINSQENENDDDIQIDSEKNKMIVDNNKDEETKNLTPPKEAPK